MIRSGGQTPNFGAQVITCYCSPTGSDSTGIGTAGNPYLTPENAARLTAVPLGAILKIDMSGYGTYTPAAPWQPPFILGANGIGRLRFVSPSLPEVSAFGTAIQYGDVFLYADPTTELSIAASAYTTSVDSITGRISYTKASAGWSVDQWAGKMLVAGTGAFTGLYRIVSNTADTLVTTNVSPLFSPAGTTLPLRIQSESCTIDLSVAGYWFFGGTRKRYDTFNLSAAGLRFTGGFYAFFQAGFTGLSLTGCSLPYGDTTTIGQATISGCSIAQTDPGSNFIQADAPRVEISNTIIRDTWMIVNAKGALIGSGLDMERINGFGDGLYHGTSGTMPAVGLVSLANSEIRNSVGAFRGVNAGWRGIVGFCRFTGCSYGGIRMERGAWCTINGYLAGSGNGAAGGDAGIAVIDNSEVYVQEFAEVTGVALVAANCTVGGVAADLVVGANPYRSMASFFGSAPLKIEADPMRGGSRFIQRSVDNQLSNMVSSLPAAGVAYRGVVLVLLGGTGVADTEHICLRQSDGSYAWLLRG